MAELGSTYLQYFTILAFWASFLGYVIGSIPFGLILTQLMGGTDIRRQGSGNIGATNVYRVAGKKLGALTLALDLLKGAAAVGVAGYFGLDSLLAGFFAVLGHIFPLWLKFRGGKGVATYLGVFLVWSPLAGLLAVFTWLLVIKVTKTSSMAGLAAAASSLVWAYAFSPPGVMLSALPLVFLIIIRHTSNIKNLLQGKEKAFK